MKKTLLYSLAALASLVLASCNEDYSDWADPQVYGQEDSASAYGVTVTAGSEINGVMPDEDGVVNLVSVTSTSEDVEDYAINSLTINGESIDASVSNGEITVDAIELSKLIETQYGSRAAVARNMEIVVSVSIVLSNGDAVTASSSTLNGTFTPTPVPDISADGYYMLGDWQGWSLTSPTVMTAQEDGTYKATVTTTSSGDNWFKFYRADSWSDSDWDIVNAGQMGCEVNGDNSMSNFVVYTDDPIYTDGVQTPVISGANTFEVIFDPINLTYTITRAEQMYYPTGTFTGWGSSEKYSILYPQGSNTYRISTYLTGAWDFKFWDTANFGDWNVMYGCPSDELNSSGAGPSSGTIISSDVQCISSPAAGYYTCTVDMNGMTYSFEEIADTPTSYSTISLTGDFNSWDTSAPVELSPLVGNDSSQDYHNWYVLGCTIGSDGGLKFIANHGWDVNWGASVDVSVNSYGNGVQNGDNITVPAGTYNIYLNDITGDFVFVAVE